MFSIGIYVFYLYRSYCVSPSFCLFRFQFSTTSHFLQRPPVSLFLLSLLLFHYNFEEFLSDKIESRQKIIKTHKQTLLNEMKRIQKKAAISVICRFFVCLLRLIVRLISFQHWCCLFCMSVHRFCFVLWCYLERLPCPSNRSSMIIDLASRSNTNCNCVKCKLQNAFFFSSMLPRCCCCRMEIKSCLQFH